MINEQVLAAVQDRVASHNSKRHGPLTFTVEHGRGETYANRELTVYAHDDYEESSVLAGRERRMWIGTFGDEPQARQDAEDTMRNAGAARITLWGGSSYVPVAQMVAHLPDDTDY